MIDLKNDYVLRRLEGRDTEAVWKCKNSKEIQDQLVGFRCGMSLAQVSSWIAFHNDNPKEILLAIARQADDLCVGHVGLYEIDHQNRRGELGILLGSNEVQGRGIGRAACIAMLDVAFDDLGFHSVYLHVMEDNARALRLYQKLGFKLDGVLRAAAYKRGSFKNVAHLTILADEWARQKSEG